MLNNFANGLMRFVGTVMFFSGMAFLAYAVIGGYYHYSPLLHAVAWGFAGWILFFTGMDLIGQYKPQQQPVAAPPPMPAPLPLSPYPMADTNTRNPFPSRDGGRQSTSMPLDTQILDD